LGFAVCSQRTAERLSEKLGPWAVSGPALWAGTQALKDQPWISVTRQRLHTDRVRLDDLLNRAGLTKIGGTDLFSLVETPDAQQIFEKLAHSGILVRAFTTYPTRLRFGLPGDETGWRRLAAAL
jgi:cobalamin biosynthetic protein CobC